MGMAYPNNHYGATHTGQHPPYYPPDGGNAGAYRERYPPGSSDWTREREFEYRRDYDRRAPPPSS